MPGFTAVVEDRKQWYTMQVQIMRCLQNAGTYKLIKYKNNFVCDICLMTRSYDKNVPVFTSHVHEYLEISMQISDHYQTSTFVSLLPCA